MEGARYLVLVVYRYEPCENWTFTVSLGWIELQGCYLSFYFCWVIRELQLDLD